MKYSFIIPVYNSSLYIERCIESITKQKSKSNFEIIVIDDGSIDSSEIIIEKLAKKYPNIIKYYKQYNQGVSVARNFGIMKSTGEFIIFVDSDDELISNFFENCEKIVGLESYDVIKTKVKCIDNKVYDERFEVPIFDSMEGNKALATFCNSNKIFALPWSYIFNRKFIIEEKLYFTPNVLHEDYALIPIILSKAKRVMSVNWYGYKYIKRENSLSTTNDNTNEIKRINMFILHTYNLIKYFSNNINNDFKIEICNYFYNRMKIKIGHVDFNVKLQMDYKLLNKVESLHNSVLGVSQLTELPDTYKNVIESVQKLAKAVFKSNLVSLVLGGSCGKNNPILKWSDIDLYVIIKSYRATEIKSFCRKTNKYSIHIGITFYTLKEIEYNMLDNKTKIMIYEKQNFKVNPTLYGYCEFKKIDYKEVILNDKNNLPNVIHEFRRMYIKVLNGEIVIDKKYMKKLLLLIKCYLNIKDNFVYGYERVISEFLLVYNRKRLSEPYYFDIMDVLINVKKNKTKVLDFSKRALDFIVEEMEEF